MLGGGGDTSVGQILENSVYSNDIHDKMARLKTWVNLDICLFTILYNKDLSDVHSQNLKKIFLKSLT